ncbi:MAG: glutathione S-transferase [Pseudomonadota bacterium]|nr:glutathione S-transferase [Pseudomonadota bacterium]
MTYRLYYSPGACSMAVHIVLEEIGAPFELELVLSRGEREGAMTATPEWRAVNPKGRIPALAPVPGSAGGAAELLTEVPAILLYLALEHPEAGLLPRDPASLARAVEWMNWLSGNVHAMAYGQIWRAQRFSGDEAALPSIRERGRASLADHHAYIERLLADGRSWALPSGYSVVDPYLLVFFQWGQRIGLAMRDYPAWSALTDAMLARPAVRRVLEREGVAVA